jgi:uncharacterized protein (DUF1330 family)
MAFELLVGLNVVDEDGYQKYREGTRPLLEACGGYFRYDFAVSKVLKGEAQHHINRVFVVVYPDRDTQVRLFKDPAYLRIREAFFTPSVAGATRLAEYER